ncbi:MAG: ABC transporter permease [Sedimentibacter sp.]|uniref:ABC transporter permease n=1 Tax=Sedimentibacter sp. TaxID=1960295 RepID=UPI003158B629
MENNLEAKAISEEYDIESEIAENDKLYDKIKSMIKTNKVAAISGVLILFIIITAVLAPIMAPYDPYAIDLLSRLKGPSAAHLLGTDELGRDVLSRIIYGSRVSLFVGLVPTLLSMVIGAMLGLISGYFGGKVDFVIMRLADVVLAFPSLLLAMVIMYTLGASTFNLFIALTIINWAGTARVVRSQTMSLKEKEFIEAARSIGVKDSVIMFKHVLPNCLPSLIVLFTTNIPGAILSEANLSFLGVGAQPPQASWGLMVNNGKKFLFTNPVMALAPGIAILVIVLTFNFLGDGLRDAIDPYMKE